MHHMETFPFRMPPACLITAFLLLLSFSTIQAWDCESSCGGITLNYPFGSAYGCGSSAFQPYVNCSSGKLLFYTPTGTYQVQSIDYTYNVMVVIDPQMSTCTSMQLSGSFGLPIGAPFSFASYNKVVLIGCSSTSSLYSKQSCDTSTEAQEVCQSIYENCQGISQIGIVATSSSGTGWTSSCCVYSSSLLATAPYEVDLPLLQCSTYTSVYQMGSIQTPQSSWLYGIALQYVPSSQSTPSGTGQSPPSGNTTGQNPSCYVCQEAEESHGPPAPAPWFAGLLLMLAAVTSLSMLWNLPLPK